MYPGQGKITLGPKITCYYTLPLQELPGIEYTNTSHVCLTEQIQQWPKLVYLVQPENQ